MNIHIRKKDVISAGSCNFCNQLQLANSTGGNEFKYPYDTVNVITADGSNIEIRICDYCLDILQNLRTET